MLISRSYAAAAFLFSTLAAGAAEYQIAIDPSKDVYVVGETIHFDIVVTQDGAPLDPTSAVVTATYPDAGTGAPLVAIAPGVFVHDALATESGERTLTVTVRDDLGMSLEAMQARAEALAAEIAELTARLQDETDPKKAFVLAKKIANRSDPLTRVNAKIEADLAPDASQSATIAVLEVTTDTEPPAFGAVLPDGVWTNNPYAMIFAEVSDAGSGVESVLLLREDSSEPIVMDFDGDVATYVPIEGWDDGASSLLIVAFDNAGNAASLGVELRVDTLAPVFTSFSLETTNSVVPTLVIAVAEDLSGADPASITLLLDSNSVAGLSYKDGIIMYTPGQPLVPGLHYVDVSATDFAGNTGVALYTMSVAP